MSYKRLAIATITIGLVATGVAPAHAAIKAGAKCTSAKTKIVDQGLTYTCVKSGKKLSWSKGVEPVAPTSFADLEQNAKSVAYWAWKKSSQVVSTSTAKMPTITTHVGPNSELPNNQAKTAVELVNKLYPTATTPKDVHFVYYNFKDLAWAQAMLDKFTNNDPSAAGEAEHNCRAEMDCRGASARTARDGLATVLIAIQGGKSFSWNSSAHANGTLEAHEYAHNVQQAPSVGTNRNWAMVPRWYVEGGAEFAQTAAVFFASHNMYIEDRRQWTQDLTKGTWFTEQWLEEFINPPGWKDWSVWDKYAGWRVYDVGFAVTEILTALKGPAATMELFDLVAQGSSYEEAFEKTYGIKWLDAVPIISRTIYKEFKS